VGDEAHEALLGLRHGHLLVELLAHEEVLEDEQQRGVQDGDHDNVRVAQQRDGGVGLQLLADSVSSTRT
jgi:hypothetical protein